MSHGVSTPTGARRWGGAGLVGGGLVVTLRYLFGLSPAETAVAVAAVGTCSPYRSRPTPTDWPTSGGAVGAGAVELGKAVWAASGFDGDGQRVSHAFAAGGAAMAPLGAVSRSVVDALEGRPHTRSELGAAVDAEADNLDRALNELQARGAVVRAGREYRLAEDDGPGFG